MKKWGLMISAVLFGMDLFWKEKTERKEEPVKETSVFGGRVLIRKVHNHGMAFQILDQKKQIVKNTSLAAAIFVLVCQIRFLAGKGHRLESMGSSLMLSGACSNLYDRMRRGYVVDYIAFETKKEEMRNLTFNIGDFCLAAGAGMIGLAAVASYLPKKAVSSFQNALKSCIRK